MADTMAAPSLLLPEGTRLIHIGPPKTGTTAVQGAFHAQRAAVLAQGVRYAGGSRHSVTAVLAATGRPSFFGNGEPAPLREWESLVREIHRAREPRVVLSSEFMADAQPEAITRIATNLDPVRLHIVATLRPLARIIPSQWQQYVQSGMRVAFDRWLDAMLNKPRGELTPTFWMRHRHDELVARWIEAVGVDRVTVVVVDEQDHAMVLRVFEQLLGLSEGTLVAEPDLANRSMTLPEIEVVRAFNIAFRAEGLDTALLSRTMHFGAATYMKLRRPEPDEPRLEMPQWALDRAGEIARQMVDAIAASGVRVVGDLESLTTVPADGLVGHDMPEVHIPPQVAASVAMGVLAASGAAPSATHGLNLGASREPLGLAATSTRQLIGFIPRRIAKAAVRRGRSIRWRVTSALRR